MPFFPSFCKTLSHVIEASNTECDCTELLDRNLRGRVVRGGWPCSVPIPKGEGSLNESSDPLVDWGKAAEHDVGLQESPPRCFELAQFNQIVPIVLSRIGVVCLGEW